MNFSDAWPLTFTQFAPGPCTDVSTVVPKLVCEGLLFFYTKRIHFVCTSSMYFLRWV